MDLIKTPGEAEKYLELFRTHENKYLIGIYQPGITIYKQQVRALNIFYCLHLTGRLKKGSTVAVIGGGIAGITFAAAASKSKIVTHIFEKYGEFIPIQSRCRGRELDPLIYDWPVHGSTNEDGDLPVMNWTRSSVELFCKRVLKELKEIKDSFHEGSSSSANYLFEYFDCERIEAVTYNTAKKKYSIDVKTLRPKGKAKVKSYKPVRVAPDVIIYAIGYGQEQSNFGERTPSYWRDMDTHQPNLTGKKYFISGTGDGALMDLMVILIKEFSYEYLLESFKKHEHSQYLFDELVRIKKEFFQSPRQPNYIYKKFEQLYSRCKGIIVAMDLNETKVVLNGLSKFENSLNLDKMSMLNAFFVYLLHKKKKFTFVKGELDFNQTTGSCSVKGNSERYDDYVHFFRHGTDRNKLLEDIPHLAKEVRDNRLIEKQLASLPNGMVEKKWVNEDLFKIFRQAHYDEIEKVSANTLPIMECFTNILADAFSELLKKTGNFRIALHKVEMKPDGPYFVQVTPYVGTINYTFKGGYARLFNAIGNVGYSIYTGKPSLITMKDEEPGADKFEDYLTQTGLANAGRKLTKRKAFFSMPILAPVHVMGKSSGGEYVTNLVLYIDADHHSFFSGSQIFETIISSTCGFIKAFESAYEKQQLNMDDIEYTFDMISDHGLSTMPDSRFFRTNDPNFKKFMARWELLVAKKIITFKKFYSFTSKEQNH